MFLLNVSNLIVFDNFFIPKNKENKENTNTSLVLSFVVLKNIQNIENTKFGFFEEHKNNVFSVLKNCSQEQFLKIRSKHAFIFFY